MSVPSHNKNNRGNLLKLREKVAQFADRIAASPEKTATSAFVRGEIQDALDAIHKSLNRSGIRSILSPVQLGIALPLAVISVIAMKLGFEPLVAIPLSNTVTASLGWSPFAQREAGYPPDFQCIFGALKKFA